MLVDPRGRVSLSIKTFFFAGKEMNLGGIRYGGGTNKIDFGLSLKSGLVQFCLVKC